MKKGHLKRHFFVAVALPDDAKRALSAQLDETQRHPGWEWKDSEDYHISLAFPGALDDRRFKEIKTILSQVDMQSFKVRLEGVSTFFKEQNRRKNNKHVVWARPDSESDYNLRRLNYKIAQTLKACGYTIGKRDQQPHVTIVKPPVTETEAVEDYVESRGTLDSVAWDCTSFVLYETLQPHDPDHPSNQNGEGSRFREVAVFNLSPS